MEVILRIPSFININNCILHVCGGDPKEHLKEAADRWGILHVCGGDPTVYGRVGFESEYSPRMWR